MPPGRCSQFNCIRHPSYGVKGSTLPLYCSKHRRPTDVDVKHRRCQHLGCTKNPVFGVKGTRTRKYCVEHRLPTDINLVNKRCLHVGCERHPSFGSPETRIRKYCIDHKRSEDVSLTHLHKYRNLSNVNTNGNNRVSIKMGKMIMYVSSHSNSPLSCNIVSIVSIASIVPSPVFSA
jgi:hypothetical protein